MIIPDELVNIVVEELVKMSDSPPSFTSYDFQTSYELTDCASDFTSKNRFDLLEALEFPLPFLNDWLFTDARIRSF